MSKKTILVVEDEANLHQALLEFLTSEGFNTLSAMDGEKALELAQAKKPDLVLLDIILPKKDGFEVMDILKKDSQTKNIPIILLTNMESAEDIQKAFEKGATTYLVKSSYKLEEIINKVKETLKD